MADNVQRYGFRLFRGQSGQYVHPIKRYVADAYQATSDGAASNVDLNPGDPVKLVSDGTVALAITTNDVWGIVAAVNPYWNGTAMTPGSRLPGATTGGGIFERKSSVMIWELTPDMLFEADCDDAVTATTRAAYEAFVGENVDHVCLADVTNAGRPKANPRLDISGHATTHTLGWRIRAVSESLDNQDFSGANVKLIVSCNNIQVYDTTGGTIGTGV